MAEYVASHGHDSQVQALLADVRHTAGDDSMPLESIVAQLLQWIDEDRKITPLKALQGMIWEEGYKARDFFGHIYPDAVEALRSWREGGLRLYVYSSGSVHAQKLLFRHTDHGDITGLFQGYFDTRIGAKMESESYRRIAAEIGLAPAEILFLSDVEGELNAASTAGMHTAWLVREAPLRTHASHKQYRDFTAIAVEVLNIPRDSAAEPTSGGK
jgi:enolase-phosphatase E1